MNVWITRTAAATAVVLGLGIGFGVAASAAPIPTPTPSSSATTVSGAVAAELAYLRDEERLAHDLYLAIAELYPGDAAPFTRIAGSEQRHFESVGLLLERYGLADPAAGQRAGSYANAQLSKLYQDLLAKAKGSLADAHAVGITVEKTDIADLEKVLAQDSLPADVTRVMSSLKTGSEHHLAAFTALADGKSVGQRDGTGQRNGYRRAKGNPDSRQGRGQRAGSTTDTDHGQDYGRTGERPADCPIR